MFLESQFPGLKWSKNLETLIDLYKKQKPILDQLKIELKEMDGELEHELNVLSSNIDLKVATIFQISPELRNSLKTSGNYALSELEENIACLTVFLDTVKAGVDTEKIRKGICVRQCLKRVDYALDQLLLFLSEPFKDLTSREQEILVNLSEGLSNEEIADKLYISIKTVKNHVSSIYRKTGFKERAKLVLAARSVLG